MPIIRDINGFYMVSRDATMHCLHPCPGFFIPRWVQENFEGFRIFQTLSSLQGRLQVAYTSCTDLVPRRENGIQAGNWNFLLHLPAHKRKLVCDVVITRGWIISEQLINHVRKTEA